MVVIHDQNRENGWRFTAAGTIDAVDAKYWKFGEVDQKFKNSHPIETQEYQAKYKSNSPKPYDIVNTRTSLEGAAAFYPTTLIPFYKVLGVAATDASHIHTITPFTEGNTLPTFTHRTQSTDGYDTGGSPGDNDKIFSGVGCKANKLYGMIDLTQGFDEMSQSLTYIGINNDTPTLNAKHTTGTMLPTTDASMTAANQIITKFKKDTNFQYRWNNVEYDDEVITFNYMIMNNLQKKYVENRTDVKYVKEGLFTFAYNVLLFRGKNSAIYDDYLAGTPRTSSLKIYSSATRYLNISWTNSKIMPIVANDAVNASDAPFWQFSVLAENVTVTGIDGIPDYTGAGCAAAEFYGETS